MEIQSIIQVVAAVVFGCVLLVKTVLFYLFINHRKLKCWFYFNAYSITNSSSERSKKAKQLQNFFTLILLVLVCGTIIFTIIMPRD